MSRAAGCELGIGVVAVIQTAGRASNYNPHLHLMVTGGGIDEQGKWREVKAISYDHLHREWQRQLFAMMGERARSTEMAALLEVLRKEYERGLVAYWEPKAVKAGKGLARYLIKYVASPPIAVSRIVAYDGQEVEYFWQDHQSHQQERARVSAAEFIRRLVQHILPKGFQRVRYLGLHAVCLRGKIMERVRKAIGATIQMAFYYGEAVLQKLGWRAKIKSKFGRDPMRCKKCGEEMILWKVWAPTHGVLYYLPDDVPKWVESGTSSRDVVQAQLRFSF
jgi:Putative transposase